MSRTVNFDLLFPNIQFVSNINFKMSQLIHLNFEVYPMC